MKLNTLAPIMVSGALLAPAAQADHKTGLDLQLDFLINLNEDDKTVEGDKTRYGFKERRARWWLGGEVNEKIDYKFRYDLRGGDVGLNYYKAGYKVAEGTKITLGKGFDPIPIKSVVADSYRMSDARVSSEAADAFNFGDLGVQLETDVGVGKVKVGLANGNAIKAAGHTSILSNLALGASFEGTFGMFSPYVGFGFQSTGSEKIKASNNEWSGRNDMDISVGAGVDLGATDLFFNYAMHEQGEVTQKNAAGVEVNKELSSAVNGFELKASQAFSDKLEGVLAFAQDNFSVDGKDGATAQKIAAQLHMYPWGNDKAYFTGSIVNGTVKPKNGDSVSANQVVFTFSIRPSYEIGHHH